MTTKAPPLQQVNQHPSLKNHFSQPIKGQKSWSVSVWWDGTGPPGEPPTMPPSSLDYGIDKWFNTLEEAIKGCENSAALGYNKPNAEKNRTEIHLFYYQRREGKETIIHRWRPTP